MVRSIEIKEDGRVEVVVSLTTAGCPIRAHFEQAVAQQVSQLDGVSGVAVGFDVLSDEEKGQLQQTLGRRKLPEGADVSLSFTGDDPRLSVQAGRSRFNLPVLPAGDFPVMSAEGFSGRIGVDVADLIRLIDKTRFAISAEETRYYLNGLYLHTIVVDGAQKLRAVATDGSRLRNAGIPTFGVAGQFYGDSNAHGMNERIPQAAFYESLEFMYRLVSAVSRKTVP